jgi:hypothetical protein
MHTAVVVVKEERRHLKAAAVKSAAVVVEQEQRFCQCMSSASQQCPVNQCPHLLLVGAGEHVVDRWTVAGRLDGHVGYPWSVAIIVLRSLSQVAYPLSLLSVSIKAMEDALSSLKDGELPPADKMATLPDMLSAVG